MRLRQLWEKSRGSRGGIAAVLLVVLAWADASCWSTSFSIAPWYVDNRWDGIGLGKNHFKKDQPAFHRARLDWGWHWTQPGFYWEHNGVRSDWELCVPHWLILLGEIGGAWLWRRTGKRFAAAGAK